MAKRADVSPINRVPWIALNQKVKGLAALPRENNCQDSTEAALPIGSAVDKNQKVYLDYLRAVEKNMHDKLTADEQRIIATMK